ncbi:MAG: PD-(D/E)XK nuclease family protein [Candidatus Riflebacteria bacterium]|nr:PD-(D/E)XK nuclease family protein [Candidatus Riflebacteria bacterium]
MIENSPDLFTRIFRSARDEDSTAIAATQSRNLPAKAPIRISLSSGKLETYKSCPLKYKFQYLERRTGGACSPHLSFDASIHHALLDYFRGGTVAPYDRLKALLARHWDGKGYENSDQEHDFREAAEEGLAACVETWFADPPRIAALDVSLNVRLFGCDYFTRADRVDHAPDGQFEIIDYKSGRKVPDVSRFAAETSLMNLYLAADARQPGKIAAVVWHFVAANKILRFKPTPGQIETHCRSVEAIVENLRAGRFPAVRGSLCAWCDFFDQCPAWPVKPHELAGEPLPTFKQRLRLSYSKMSMFENCPRAYKIAYIDHIPSRPQPFFSFGTCLHEIFERLYDPVATCRRLPCNLDTILDLLEEVWPNHRAGYATAEIEANYKQDAIRQLTLYFRHFIEAKLFKPAYAVESYFELPIGRHVVMTGFIDRIDRLEDGNYEILDYKTEPVDRTQEEIDADKQLTVYHWAVAKSLGLPVTRLSLFMLDFDKKVETHRSEKHIQALETHVEEVALRIINEKLFAPKKNKYCRNCDHLATCPLKVEIDSDPDIVSMQKY